MRYILTEKFRRDLKQLPDEVRKKARKAIELFKENQRHPSLQTHKILGTSNPTKFEGYIDRKRGYRFTFHYEDDAVVFRRAGPHSIIDEEARQ